MTIGPKSLYRVEMIAMVMAESKEDALTEAAKMDPWNSTCKVHLATSTPSEWYDCVPFGEDDDRTVGQILRDQRQAG